MNPKLASDPKRPAIPASRDDLNSEQVESLIATYTKWFSRKDVRNYIALCLPEVFNYLIDNKYNTTDRGSPEINQPWYDMRNVIKTNNWSVIDFREQQLRQRTFEESTARLLNVARDGLPEDSISWISECNNAPEWDIHKTLVRWSILGSKEYLKINSCFRSYGYKPSNDAFAAIRNNALITMSGLGLWDVKFEHPAWQIRIGHVALRLHEALYVPTVQYFDAIIGGKQAVRPVFGDKHVGHKTQ